MLTFVIRRMIATVFVVFTITVLVFLIFFHTPGVDPARKLAGRNPSPETIKAIKHQYGLDRPLPVQYVILMKKLFISRDLTSYTNQGQRVVPEIVAATPVTLSLVLGAAVIWVVVSILMGVAAAVLRGTIFDPMLMVLALIGISMPVFWLGEMVQAPGDPVAGAVGAVHRPLRAGAAGRPDRDRERGLRAHRPRQGSQREAGAAAPHAAHLDDQLREPVRPRLRGAGGR